MNLDTTENPELAEACILLALFGWELDEHDTDLLQCNLCARTVGLWNFDKLFPREETNENACRKRLKLTEGSNRVLVPSELDAYLQHR